MFDDKELRQDNCVTQGDMLLWNIMEALGRIQVALEREKTVKTGKLPIVAEIPPAPEHMTPQMAEAKEMMDVPADTVLLKPEDKEAVKAALSEVDKRKAPPANKKKTQQQLRAARAKRAAASRKQEQKA
jgi:hypothetical protein